MAVKLKTFPYKSKQKMLTAILTLDSKQKSVNLLQKRLWAVRMRKTPQTPPLVPPPGGRGFSFLALGLAHCVPSQRRLADRGLPVRRVRFRVVALLWVTGLLLPAGSGGERRGHEGEPGAPGPSRPVGLPVPEDFVGAGFGVGAGRRGGVRTSLRDVSWRGGL